MELCVDTIYFDAILSGVKKYEIRIFDSKRQLIKLLDTLIFRDRNSDRVLEKKVIELSYFTNFQDAITDVDISSILPNVNTIQEAVQIYEAFSEYKTASEKYGVLRIKLQ